ncbi:RING finger protein 10-like [Zingiber officinale]|uniref:RING finger protein 10-like n=1 Tax=Zingiber officinale TaxID=94328 RepID=UPI001C4CE101|nr:RING finger protein 10-like [Zingiber officinale]
MSINPSDAQRSAASLPLPSYPNASSRHGTRRESPRSLASWSEGLPCGRAADAASGSAAAYAFDNSSPSSAENHESAIAAGGNSHNLPKKVNRHRVNDFKKSQFGKKRGTNVEHQSTVGEEVPPYCKANQFVHVVENERPFVNVNLVHSSGPSSFQGNGSQSSTRRNNAINANHLLNFYYDPISRPEPRAPPPRRQRKVKPYNKDLFLQANYRFVVLNRESSEVESIDPDKMLNWEDVVCVRYSTPFTVQCPICLETPLCPQITTCGHIYCFPCILRYLLMGEENHKGVCWKKCPLCFMVISIKDLYSVLIENVKNFSVGDHAHFTLLTRSKDSVFPVPKSKQVESTLSSSADDLCDTFSKFIVTSDVGLSVRKGKSDLTFWLHKADSGLVDDLEKLPYVCAALEQLEERMKMWRELHTYNVNTQNRDNLSSLATNLASDKLCTDEPQCVIPSYIPDEDGFSIEIVSKVFPVAAEYEHVDSPKQVPPSHNGSEKLQHDDISSQKNSVSNNEVTERDSYSFYQATDGQLLILHPLNMKCLLHHFGSYDMLPSSINGEILELEAITQSEAMRKRYRYLSHFSLTTTFQLCELDLKHLLPFNSLAPFMDEINKREKQRRRLAKKEKNERGKAEAASHFNLVPSAQMQFAQKDIVFSSDDFEALTTNSIPSSSPPTGERKLFSDVTRLGFAAAHDSPSLRGGEAAAESSGHATKASNVQASGNTTTSSFATILSSAREVESSEQHTNALVKKGKKPNKVLLSTAGGRRY